MRSSLINHLPSSHQTILNVCLHALCLCVCVWERGGGARESQHGLFIVEVSSGQVIALPVGAMTEQTVQSQFIQDCRSDDIDFLRLSLSLSTSKWPYYMFHTFWQIIFEFIDPEMTPRVCRTTP